MIMTISDKELGEKLLKWIRRYHQYCHKVMVELPDGNITTQYKEGDLMICKACKDEIALLEEEINKRNKKIIKNRLV